METCLELYREILLRHHPTSYALDGAEPNALKSALYSPHGPPEKVMSGMLAMSQRRRRRNVRDADGEGIDRSCQRCNHTPPHAGARFAPTLHATRAWIRANANSIEIAPRGSAPIGGRPR